MRIVSLVAALLFTSCTAATITDTGPSPTGSSSTASSGEDPCHSGTTVYCVLNPDVGQSTIQSTICRPGWTATIRPPATYTEDLKRRQMAAEGLSGPLSGYEEDHRLALELGGAPRDEHNLSPESHNSSFVKDKDESLYRERVCNGSETLTQAQREFVQKWLGPYPVYRA
jgi:hypothetical protein